MAELKLSYRVARRKLTDTNIQARLEFAELVHRSRTTHRYSLADVADQLGTTRQAIWEYEHGCMPSDENLSRLADVLRLSYNQLLMLKETE